MSEQSGSSDHTKKTVLQRLSHKGREVKSDPMNAWFEFRYGTLPQFAFIGAVILYATDKALNLHVAEHLADVQVDPTESGAEQWIDKALHDIGVEALELEK